ncbi:MAG: Unknown protein [uncultured Aureispira sp.]|uniref:DUF4349 domain-containing protein n=1 Tax=uncultured Aureispira sp. TaxID=1331704 RepID=A0A6S6TRP1_9BACT|nr:MAG: Unknown protein [uncultured Aureispira sp.]
MKIILISYLFLFLLFSCDSNLEGNYQTSPKNAEEIGSTEGHRGVPGAPQAPSDLMSKRKIIRTGEMKFKVNSLEKSTKVIQALTEKCNGFISSMDQNNSNYLARNVLAVRIPTDQFDYFLFQMKEEALYADYIRVNAKDVTEEFIDIEGRLKNKKEVQRRYIEILQNKAKTVEDVLAAEEKIRVIQEEIESKEGRLRYLKDNISLSTIKIEMYQVTEQAEAAVVYKKGFFSKAVDAFANGWNFILELLVGLITIWPILLIVSLVVLFRKKLKRMIGKE